MSGPEFYANATLGFRQWRLRWKAGGEGPPFLESLVKHGFHQPICHRWDLTGLNHAECMRRVNRRASFSEVHGDVPGTGCSCGFYAHGRRDGSNSKTTVHVVGGVVAGWGNLELHEGGFRCSVAKVLALFEPDLHESHADFDGMSPTKWAALERMCTDNAIPLLPADALTHDGQVRHYAGDRYLVLHDDQLGRRRPFPARLGTA